MNAIYDKVSLIVWKCGALLLTGFAVAEGRGRSSIYPVKSFAYYNQEGTCVCSSKQNPACTEGRAALNGSVMTSPCLTQDTKTTFDCPFSHQSTWNPALRVKQGFTVTAAVMRPQHAAWRGTRRRVCNVHPHPYAAGPLRKASFVPSAAEVSQWVQPVLLSSNPPLPPLFSAQPCAWHSHC